MDSPGSSGKRRSAPGSLKARATKLDTWQRRQQQLKLVSVAGLHTPQAALPGC